MPPMRMKGDGRKAKNPKKTLTRLLSYMKPYRATMVLVVICILLGSLASAISSIADRLVPGGLFMASIRDYDALLAEKPPYSPPYIHKTDKGQRVSFQTWVWDGDRYKLTQYIIDDEETLQVSKFDCEYRATRRQEITDLLLQSGFGCVEWKFPQESGFYQPIVVAKK